MPWKETTTMEQKNEFICGWKSYYWVYVSAALNGKYVGIEELGNGIWKVFYRNVFLGFFNQNELRKKQQSTRLETNLV